MFHKFQKIKSKLNLDNLKHNCFALDLMVKSRKYFREAIQDKVFLVTFNGIWIAFSFSIV